MNRIDRQLEMVGQPPRETVTETEITRIRHEMDELYARATRGVATEADADRFAELSHRLLEIEGPECHTE
ncbi:MAG: hypothetical protein WD492_12675 [Alkalispirochaeta sp.]